MRGVNKTITVGTLGNDPEVKQFNNGGSIATISVAVSEQWNDKNSGERKESTEWLRIVFSNKLAEIAAQYLRKGSKVYIEGKLKTRKYQDNQGIERYVTEIHADQMQMLGDKNDNGQQVQGTNYNRQPQGNFQQPQGQAYAQQMVANAPQPQFNQGYTNQNSGGFANGQQPLGTPSPSDVNMNDVPF